MKVFVYGTLMSHHPNHAKYLGNADYIGIGYLKDYALYEIEWYPGIKEKIGHTVIGEVYEITQESLEQLDQYEDEGDLYTRISVLVGVEEYGLIEASTYIYNLDVTDEQLVPCEQFLWKKTNG